MGFRSGLEEKVADLMVNLDVKYEYESTKIPYQIQFNYTPDFLLPNGVYLECKGYWEAGDRRKNKAKHTCLLYTSPSPRDRTRSRMPSSA